MQFEKSTRERIKAVTQERIPESNMLVSKALIVFSLICFCVWILFQFGFLKSKGLFVSAALIATPILFLSCAGICLLRKGQGKAFQFIFFFLLCTFWLGLELMSGYKSKLLLPVMIVLSLRYYDRRFTIFTYCSCIGALLASVWCNAYLYRETGLIDLNLVRLDVSRQMTISGFLYDNIILLNPSSESLFQIGIMLTFLPNVIFLTAITVLAIRFMKGNLLNIIKAEELAEQDANRRVELVDLKTKNMLSQVKPHFVYNTLSSIAMLCTKNPEQAKELTLDFSEYLRNNLDTLESDSITLCPFKTELEHIETYLRIESIRFGDRLKVEYDIRTTDFFVPSLSVQPIVENAVKHGVCRKADGGTVTIFTEKITEGYRIIISDDCVGFDTEAVKNDGRAHIGLANVKKRIELYGGTMNVESTPGAGTKVTVTLKNTEE